MNICQNQNGCKFYQSAILSASEKGKFYIENYCNGDNSKCARLMVFMGKGCAFVSADLFPDHIDRAYQILNESDSKSGIHAQ